jgi:xylose isomerase
VGRVLLLIKDLPNVGALIDWGHALQGGENVAESAALLAAHGKLDYIHLNDNYRTWDDDMMVGSIHLVEYLELAYWLRRVNYKGYLTLDIFPYREQDKVAVATQCKAWMEAFFRAVDRVGMDAFAQAIAKGDATATSELVRKAFNI